MSAIPSTSNMLSELPYGIPRTNDDADLETTLHGVSEVDPASFKLRGKTYCTDYVKHTQTGPALCDLMHVDVLTTKEKVDEMALRNTSFLQQRRRQGDTRYYIVVCFQCPTSPMIHVAFYYAAPDGFSEQYPEFKKAWERFLSSETYRNARWKVIPRVPHGSWVVRRAVGSRPALLAQKLTHKWYLYDNHFEVDCDVGSSTVASALTGLLASYKKHIVIDLAFLIEGREEDELPEHILGTVRLYKINLDSLPSMEHHEGTDG